MLTRCCGLAAAPRGWALVFVAHSAHPRCPLSLSVNAWLVSVSMVAESYISFLRTEHPSVPVVAHDFVRTGHVQHFLREPAEYARRLRDFLETLQKNAQTKRTLLAAQRAG